MSTNEMINKIECSIAEIDRTYDMVLVVCETLEHAGDSLPDLPGNCYAEVLLAAHQKYTANVEALRGLIEEMRQEEGT